MSFKEWQQKYYPDIGEETQAKLSHAWVAGGVHVACKMDEPCENCPEWEKLKHDKDPWLIHCPTCGRGLN